MAEPATTEDGPGPGRTPGGWVTAPVLGILLATFCSDLSHEMATAVLPLYLGSIGLGAGALGLIEGVSDFVISLAKLSGGVVGHRVRRKQPVVAALYGMTTLATGLMAFARGPAGLLALRCLAWVSRGFRSPLRDFLLSDAVPTTHYGRVYGLERAADMLGAVGGPLVAAALVGLGFEFRAVLLVTLLPGLGAALSIALFARDRVPDPIEAAAPAPTARASLAAFPRAFWVFLVGVALFGLGDFSRTFLVWMAARSLGGGSGAVDGSGLLSAAVGLYALHNLVSAAVAYPVGAAGDRYPRVRILVAGYALGVATNLLLAVAGGSLGLLAVAVALSGTYIAVEETLEKAVAASFLPRASRTLGLGLLACANATGDMVSSLSVGYWLDAGRPDLAFGLAAAAGVLGVAWLLPMALRGDGPRPA